MRALERMGASRVSDEGAGKGQAGASMTGRGEEGCGKSSTWCAVEATDLADHVDEARLHVVDNSKSPCETRMCGEGQMRARNENLDRRAKRVGLTGRAASKTKSGGGLGPL